MLTGDRAKYFGLVFAIAFCTFLLENQTSIFAGILKRTGQPDPRRDRRRGLGDGSADRVLGADEGAQGHGPDAGAGRPGRASGRSSCSRGTRWRETLDGKFAVSFLLGLDDATLAGAPRKMLLGSWERLREPDSVIIDKAGYVLLFPGEPLELGARWR